MDFSKNSADTTKTQTPDPTVQKTVSPKRRSAWSTVAFLFMILLLIALAVAAWMWYMWQDTTNQLNGVKSDVNSAQSTIANLNQKLGKATGQAAAEASLPVNDEANIKAAAKSYNAALASPLKDVKVEVAKKDGDQAIANVSDVTAGYKVYLKKADGAWIVIWSGQNAPSADIAQQFGIKL